jgi:hypothetical protein
MKRKHLIQWLVFSISGLVLIGAGLSVFGEAVIIKLNKKSVDSWFWVGTLSLILINSGISFVGRGVISKIKYDFLKKRYRKNDQEE